MEAVIAEILFQVPKSILVSFCVINGHKLSSLFIVYCHFSEFLVQEFVHGQSQLLVHSLTFRSQGRSWTVFSGDVGGQESIPELSWTVGEFPPHIVSRDCWPPLKTLWTSKGNISLLDNYFQIHLLPSIWLPQSQHQVRVSQEDDYEHGTILYSHVLLADKKSPVLPMQETTGPPYTRVVIPLVSVLQSAYFHCCWI